MQLKPQVASDSLLSANCSNTSLLMGRQSKSLIFCQSILCCVPYSLLFRVVAHSLCFLFCPPSPYPNGVIGPSILMLFPFHRKFKTQSTKLTQKWLMTGNDLFYLNVLASDGPNKSITTIDYIMYFTGYCY